jgi:hypothetical protein
MTVQISEVDYRGWPNSLRLANGLVDLVVTTDVGPRVIRWGFAGGENEFAEFESDLGLTGGSGLRLYGGHRLWHAPEVMPRTYGPDNGPVALEQHGEFVRVIQPVEPGTGIQKELDIALDPDAARARVTHRLRNLNVWPVDLAPWAITIMRPGGTAILPLPPRKAASESLQLTAALALWAYTDMSDPRWRWGRRFILLRPDPELREPQKAGLNWAAGWIAWARGGSLFVKRVVRLQSAEYPDMGSSIETYCAGDVLEIETLAPLSRLEPGATAEHLEEWLLFSGVPVPENDGDVAAHVLPKIPSA